MDKLVIKKKPLLKNKKSRAWLTVLLLFFVGLLNYLDRTTITTMHNSIVTAIPMSEKQFSLLTTLFLWVYGLASPFAGHLADRFSKSRVIIISLFIWSAVTWLTAHAVTYNQLLATRALMGISEACYIPAALALITDYHKDKTQSTAVGIHMAGVFIGASLGFIGGWIAQEHEWNLAFTIFGVIGITYAIVLSVLLKDAPREKPAVIFTGESSTSRLFRINFVKLIRNRSFLFLIAFWSLLSIVSWLIIGWLPVYYLEKFQLSQKEAGIYATAYLYPASVLGLITGGILADWWSKKNIKGRIWLPAVGLVIAIPAIYCATQTNLVSLAITGFIIYAITKAFSDTNMMPILTLVTDPSSRATAYGTLNLFSCIVGGAGIYIGGLLRDAAIPFGQIFQTAIILIPICILLLLIIKPTFISNSKS